MFALLLCRPEIQRDSLVSHQTLLGNSFISMMVIRPVRFFR